MPIIRFESPDQREVWALVEALDVYQRSLYPPESCFHLDLASLLRPEVRFVVARDDSGVPCGCAALVLQPSGELKPLAELKRMYVQPTHRGQGLAESLVGALEAEAVRLGCVCVRLETGIHQAAALSFYERMGYQRRARFADYPDDPLSVFMEKALG